ncbi:uncharacterized protein LOC120647927 [Panicum virgatum]|uniref:uncharacterized protein LOC120647927 n=1 Tax=Panicum virgatum TaxID=38727 RepID=UPI0019D52798|nr:uncharacterized protein LOC120647927 [Panicum virgatum]
MLGTFQLPESFLTPLSLIWWRHHLIWSGTIRRHSLSAPGASTLTLWHRRKLSSSRNHQSSMWNQGCNYAPMRSFTRSMMAYGTELISALWKYRTGIGLVILLMMEHPSIISIVTKMNTLVLSRDVDQNHGRKEQGLMMALDLAAIRSWGQVGGRLSSSRIKRSSRVRGRIAERGGRPSGVLFLDGRFQVYSGDAPCVGLMECPLLQPLELLLRFGRCLPVRRPVPAGRRDRCVSGNPDPSVSDLAALHLNFSPLCPNLKSFDPMEFESRGCRGIPANCINLVDQVGYTIRAHPMLGEDTWDPLCLEAALEPPVPLLACSLDTQVVDSLAHLENTVALESVRFSLSPNSGVAQDVEGGSPAGAGRIVAKTAHSASAAGLHNSAQRAIGKEIAPPCYKPGGVGTERDDEETGYHFDTQPPDASSFQQFTETFSSNLTPSQCEALDALLQTWMGALANWRVDTYSGVLRSLLVVLFWSQNQFPMLRENCLVWNVRGLNSKAHRNVVRELVAQENISLLSLQETKLEVCPHGLILEMCGTGFNYFFLPATNTCGE